MINPPKPKPSMEESLKLFLSSNGTNHIESNGSMSWQYKYVSKKDASIKANIAIVFSKYIIDGVVENTVDDVGYVLVIPSYWADIDRDLSIPYIWTYLGTYLDGLSGNSVNANYKPPAYKRPMYPQNAGAQPYPNIPTPPAPQAPVVPGMPVYPTG